MKKKLGFTFLFVLLAYFSVSAQQPFSAGGFLVVHLDDARRTVKIVGWEGTGQNVNIPSQIGEVGAVTAIGDGAFQNRGLTAVTIPQGVRTIGARAFSGNQLTDINIPNGVSRIGDQAFANNRLYNANIPNSVIAIGYRAFSHNRLSSIVIPNNMTTVGERAFFENRLSSVTILNSMATIGEQAFRQNGVTSITIGGNIQIHNTAFGNNFHVFYNNNRQMAGVYTWNGREWAHEG